MACASGALPLVSALLKAGADPNICDRTEASCVAMASSAGHAHVLRKLPGPNFGEKKAVLTDVCANSRFSPAVFHASRRSNWNSWFHDKSGKHQQPAMPHTGVSILKKAHILHWQRGLWVTSTDSTANNAMLYWFHPSAWGFLNTRLSKCPPTM